MQFWVPSTILRTEKKYKCDSNWISEWWISLFVVIVFVLITYYVTSPLLIGKKFVDDVHTFYEDHGLDLKIKNLSEKMSTCFCLMACHARNGWVLQWLPFSQSALPYLFSATLPVNDLCFLILSWSLEHASIFLTWAQNQSNLLAKKILPLWKENHLFTAYMYYCWYAVLVGW